MGNDSLLSFIEHSSVSGLNTKNYFSNFWDIHICASFAWLGIKPLYYNEFSQE